MKTMFASLTDFAKQLEADRSAKADYEAHTELLEIEPGTNALLMEGQRYQMTDHFRSQLHDRLGVPTKYAERMRADAPELYARTMKTWWTSSPEVRTIRTMGGDVPRARAYLSNRYAIIDNEQIASEVLPILGEIKDARFESLSITDEAMRIKVISPRIQGEVSTGDAVQLGLSISNSEIGAGAFKIEPLLFRLVCKNGMIREDGAFRQAHLGGRQEGRGPVWKMDTQRAESIAAVLKGRDVVNAMLTPATLEAFLHPMRLAKGVQIAEPTTAIKRVAKLGSLSEREQEGILAHLINGGDVSQYGLTQAVTRFAQDVDADRADHLERLGHKVLQLRPSEFRVMAEAA